MGDLSTKALVGLSAAVMAVGAIGGVVVSRWTMEAQVKRCADVPAYHKPEIELTKLDRVELRRAWCHL